MPSQSALADRYVIEWELGHGGMATVYLARDLKHKRRVALRVLNPDLAASLGAARFVREIEITAGLTHPHILPLYDCRGQSGTERDGKVSDGELIATVATSYCVHDRRPVDPDGGRYQEALS